MIRSHVGAILAKSTIVVCYLLSCRACSMDSYILHINIMCTLCFAVYVGAHYSRMAGFAPQGPTVRSAASKWADDLSEEAGPSQHSTAQTPAGQQATAGGGEVTKGIKNVVGWLKQVNDRCRTLIVILAVVVVLHI